MKNEKKSWSLLISLVGKSLDIIVCESVCMRKFKLKQIVIKKYVFVIMRSNIIKIKDIGKKNDVDDDEGLLRWRKCFSIKNILFLAESFFKVRLKNENFHNSTKKIHGFNFNLNKTHFTIAGSKVGHGKILNFKLFFIKSVEKINMGISSAVKRKNIYWKFCHVLLALT